MKPVRWTYDNSNLTARDLTRFKAGDTNDLAKIFDDNEIDAMLSLYNGSNLAAAALLDVLAVRYAGSKTTITVDGLTVADNRSQQFAALAQRLREIDKNSAGALGIPFVGGVSVSEMDSVDSDTDRTPSRFKVGQDEFQRINAFVQRSINSQ